MLRRGTRDIHGNEGHGPIHARREAEDFDWIEMYHAFKYYLVRWRGAPERLGEVNVRVLGLEVVEGGGEGEVVLRVSGYTEAARRWVNYDVVERMMH